MSDHRIRRYRINLRIERDNAALYARLAALAADERLARAYRRIADGEQANAGFWESRPRKQGWLAQVFSSEFVMPTVVRLEHANHDTTPVDRSGYRGHLLPPQAPAAHGRSHRAQSGTPCTPPCWAPTTD